MEVLHAADLAVAILAITGFAVVPLVFIGGAYRAVSALESFFQRSRCWREALIRHLQQPGGHSAH